MSDSFDTITYLSLSQLRPDDEFQPRSAGLVEAHVQLLLESDPASWPPLLVTPHAGGGYDLIDGFHRFEAARRLGLTTLPCRVDPAADYFSGVAANTRHGLPLSAADRKAAARWLAELEPDLSYRELGRRVGLSDKTVKRALAEVTGTARSSTPPDAVERWLRQTYRLDAPPSRATVRAEIEAYVAEDRAEVARFYARVGRVLLEATQPYLEKA